MRRKWYHGAVPPQATMLSQRRSGGPAALRGHDICYIAARNLPVPIGG
jgi:hypothetical protein